ncbi:uncharacterized protein LOC143346333 [Colletes latitarsis]|uniref:uncharacterized protein LOC143346333 n=1 Tax=Colletes latitarsis TaxID=2605962 RepID=UPI004037584C
MAGQMYRALLLIAILSSGCVGQQAGLGMDWLSGLHDSIHALNRNIQQVNQQVQDTVQGNLAQIHQLSGNLHEGLRAGTVQSIGGSNVVMTTQDGTRIVQSGRTSDGKEYVRESTDKIVGDTLRHVDRIYDPATNTTRVFGYTLDLKDLNSKPVLIDQGP